MERPSIAMIPSAYRNGIVYSVLPINGSADLDFTRATSATSFNATRVENDNEIQEVASNTPRLDYKGNGCPSLLLEPESTNLITYSEDFSQGWLFNSSVIANQAISPNGDYNSDEIPNSLQRIAKNGASSINIDNTFSIYVKLVNSDYFTLSSYKGTTDWVAATFDITNGVVTNEGVGIGSSVLDAKPTIEKLDNGYCRISITNNTSISAGINLQRVDNPTHSYSDYGVADDTYADGYAYIWGAQLEPLSYTTSYIPTLGSIETRDAEELSKDGLSDYINSSEGVFYAEVKGLEEGGLTRSIQLTDSSGNNDRVAFYLTSNTNEIVGLINIGGSATSFTSSAEIQTEYNKIAIKWGYNNYALWINGVEIDSDLTKGTFPLGTLTKINFNTNNFNNLPFYGNVRDLRVYTTALTDEELTQLTS